jgi:PAS domain S-box-containing protein
METSIFTAVMVTAGAVLIFLGVYSLYFRKIPVAIPFSAFMLASAGWSLTYALDSTLTDLATKTLLFQLEFVFIILIPLLSLTTMIAYVGRSDLLTRRFVAIILLLPLISIFLDLTNDYHHLFTASLTLSNTGTFLVLLDSPGPFFTVYLLYAYGYLLTGLFLIIRHTVAARGIFRRQGLLVLVALAVPMVGDVLYQLGITLAKGVSIAPALFVVSGALLAFALFRFKLFELIPIAKGALMSHSPDPILVLDDRDQLVELNQAALETFNLEKKQVIGKAASEAFREHAQMVKMLQTPAPASFEVSILVRGEELIYDSRIIPMNDPSDNPIGMLVMMRDITRRKMIENEVKLSEARYRGLLENAPFPAFIIAMSDGGFLLVNSRAETLMGVPREELLGKPAANYSAIFKDQERLVDLLSSEGRFDDLETSIVDGKGEIFWARLSGSLITFENEQVVFMAVNDISHLKLAEILRLANRKLNLLTEITRNELLNKFMVINGYLEMLDMVKGEVEKEDILRHLREASLAAQRIIRFTESYQKLGMEPPGWLKISEHIILARSHAQSEGIKIEEECGPLRLFADPLLENVFCNLVDFTLKHSTDARTITIRCEREESGALRLLFENDGRSVGVIDPELFAYHSGKEELLPLLMVKEILNMTGLDIRQAPHGEPVRFIISIPPDKFQF